MTGKAQMRCSHCGELHEITLHSSINAMQEPALKASVKDGSLFVWECPHCGTANLARYACLYHDPQERLMIWLLPDTRSRDGFRRRHAGQPGRLYPPAGEGCGVTD